MSSTPKTITSSQFFTFVDCFLCVLDCCDWGSLVAISHTNPDGRDMARRIVRHRIRCVLDVFFNDWQRKMIFDQMDRTGAMIADHVVWAVMAGSVDMPIDMLPTDIKIITPCSTYEAWITVLQHTGYCLSGESILGMGLSVKKSMRFWSPFQASSITIVESGTESILCPALTTRFTSEMSLLSSSRIFCFYPQLVRPNITVSGYHFASRKEVDWWKDRGVNHFYNTYDWKKPCGTACSAIWRLTEGFQGIGELAWGGFSGDKDVDGNMGNSDSIRKSKFKWRIGAACQNKYCKYRMHFEF
ncbi:hypothetical protein Hypma_009537 [Hypsizygus marmoreus]|uniref:Uncharacterized protein n=1 Tax=Hypsizygus marmoreus TaxID=39966 RepID=A0A369JR58_HYPMA|nr:hypothetical protein Hypma_009537 [Hypsizygus marmoreus]